MAARSSSAAIWALASGSLLGLDERCFFTGSSYALTGAAAGAGSGSGSYSGSGALALLGSGLKPVMTGWGAGRSTSGLAS